MYTIDLTVRNTPFPVSIQRKTAEDADAVYQLVMTAMRSGSPDIIELKCEGKIEKKIAVRASEVSGVIVSQKEGVSGTGARQPGFFVLNES